MRLLAFIFEQPSYSCEDKIEKSVPRDHRLSSLGKPRDAKRRPRDGCFYHTFILMIDYYSLAQGQRNDAVESDGLTGVLVDTAMSLTPCILETLENYYNLS